MYAIVRSGGKQYRVSRGDHICLEKLEGKVGDQVTLKDVLMVDNEGQVQFGTPLLTNATVTGRIVREAKGPKIRTYKMKRRKNYRRTKGHRQAYSYVKVEEIALS